jgi:hypothetical protein
MVKGIHLSTAVVMILATLMLAACSQTQTDDPKQVVIAMFGAMEKDDKAALIRLLDIPELMKDTGDDYATQGKPRVWTSPEQILDDLTGEGQTKTVWFKHQRIINTVKVQGESATVEVTFMNKETSRAYMTKFGVHKKHGKWMIYSFKTFEQRPQTTR